MDMSLKQFLEAINYKIGAGDEFLWKCYGPNARSLDSDFYTDRISSVIFDAKTQEVYEAQVHDYNRETGYRWTNPAYKGKYQQEAADRGVDGDLCYDDVYYTDLEDVEDFLEKTNAIIEGRPYDDRIKVPINAPEHELVRLMKLAHERDITLNKLITEILEDVIAKEKEKHYHDGSANPSDKNVVHTEWGPDDSEHGESVQSGK